MLDVGCAKGNFLGAARESGWQVKGVELSDYAAQRARAERGLDVFDGSLRVAIETGFVAPESFDVVTMWDTAEHLTEPLAVFRDCWSLLKPGGLLFVQTLNVDSDRAKKEGTGWHFFRPPKHLVYYGERTLKGYFERAGFRIVRNDNFAHDVVTLGGMK